MTITVKFDIPLPPKGWIYDGFRRAKRGEMFWDGSSWVEVVSLAITSRSYPVARKFPTRRPAEPKDIGSPAFFKDKEDIDWQEGLLIFIVAQNNFVGILDDDDGYATNWERCEVAR